MENCFHGRTLGAIAMGKEKYQKGFAPIPEGFRQVPFNDTQVLEDTVTDETVAVIMEPIQGEGGIRPVDEVYIKKARELCDIHDALLILDEIQCGVARTGTLYAYQQYGVRPDIVASAKALGVGVPIGAVIAKNHVAAAFEHGNHGTTFGGNPLACAAACATLSTILDEDLAAQAAEKGDYFMDTFREKTAGWDVIKEVRGRGLMIGVELNFEGADVVKEMLQRGVIGNCASGNVMRIVPPLIITKEQLDKVIDVLIESIKKVEKNYG